MKLLHVVGTRPNFVKMAPVIAAGRERFGADANVVVHTGQHYDRAMSDVFFTELGVPEPDHMLGVGSGSHAEQVARVIERLEPILAAERPDLVLVPGDVNSTLAATLCAVRAGVAVGHVESGLRSFDREMPEEINRIAVDHLSELCFLHSAEAEQNLADEGVSAERAQFVGNTMIDTLAALEDRIRERGTARERGYEPGRYILVTLHRPALVDGPLLADAMTALAEVAQGMQVVFPVHPRTRKRLAELGLDEQPGIQEETTWLGVPCFTLRDNTERPVTVRIGTNRLLGLDPEAITKLPAYMADADLSPQRPHLWDGRAAERIVDILADR
jgi:UDP-N-acetylglucosamine 2-epimerase (non-hydrolysing)